MYVTKSTDYVIASTRSTFANSPVSFHEPCLPTGAPPGSSRQEFQKEKHSSRTEATAKTLVLKKTTGIRNTGGSPEVSPPHWAPSKWWRRRPDLSSYGVSTGRYYALCVHHQGTQRAYQGHIKRACECGSAWCARVRTCACIKEVQMMIVIMHYRCSVCS